MGACELESGDAAPTAILIRKMKISIAQTLPPTIFDGGFTMPKMTTGDRPELKPVNVGAVGIDIGSRMHMAAVDRPAQTCQCERLAHSRKTCMIWRTGSKRAA
jgi:hypothetical protein